ncbi:hypothetical protein SAMN05216325_105155 [Nitrosomonas marina]|uniref:Uncharacterized protein n=1 Tax=Nitrosomonas marina TaxID=917 RepID=A0A1H8CX71_9PROT|nr:hypothetical protein SAMN05216325_105155 [Nitrosomonas marina]
MFQLPVSCSVFCTVTKLNVSTYYSGFFQIVNTNCSMQLDIMLANDHLTIRECFVLDSGNVLFSYQAKFYFYLRKTIRFLRYK